MSHPQMGAHSDTDEAKNVYWRCAFCLFASSRVHNRDARHVLFYNVSPPEILDGQRTDELCNRFGIELVPFRSITRPPADYHPKWNTQFIVLDALDGLQSLAAPGDAVLLLDGDIVFTQPLPGPALAQLQKLGSLTYDMGYSPDFVVNGLTYDQLQEVSKTYSPPATSAVTYCGGEFVCLSQSVLGEFCSRARRAYGQSVEKHARGETKFCEEAHLLSYVYSCMNIPVGTANGFVRRIWTNRGTFCNVQGDESRLALWHLPAEKKKGFGAAFAELASLDRATALFTDEKKMKTMFHLTVAPQVSAVLAVRRLVRNTLHKVMS